MRDDRRPILLGMNNPVYPDRPLWHEPAGCTGARVLALLRSKRPDVTDKQYLQAFDRRNLLYAAEWDADKAAVAADTLVRGLEDTGRRVLVLGETVRKLVGLPQRARLCEVRWRGCSWRSVPHPSGRCRWYNEAFAREVVSLILQEMYEEATSGS